HQSIGERLEAAHGGGRSAVAAELASHFERSGDDARAVRYLIEAAFAARARFAEREAENDLSAALRHLEALPASEERDLQEILIRTARSLARLVTQGSALDGEEEQSVERAVTLLLARPGRPELFPLLRGCWQVQVFRCHPREMAILAQRLTDLAAASGKSDRLAEAALAQGMVELLTAELAAADATLGRGWQHFEAHSEQRAAQARPLTARWREIGVQLAIAHSWSQLFQGLVPATRQSHERALAVAATGAIHPFVLGGTRLAIAAMEAQIGDLAAALRHNESGRELAEEHQLLALRDALQLQRCYIRAAAGEPGAPEIDLTAQLALAASLHPSMFHPVSRLYVVRSCLLAGAVQPGLERLAALQADCAARGVRWFDAEMARLHQRLLAHGDG
ncbi:MAG TPA: hypothetical protein VEB21_07660, partial [Terriglobales bacterium]|nr:hypothetical protein [Terriglobales bacterium]